MTKFLTRRMALSLFTATAFSVLAPGAMATDAAEEYVEKIGKDVLKLANAGSRGKATRAKFASMLSKYVNLRGITIASLGTYQKQLPPGDKEMLNELVTTYGSTVRLVCG